jgi:hypothetical protein
MYWFYTLLNVLGCWLNRLWLGIERVVNYSVALRPLAQLGCARWVRRCLADSSLRGWISVGHVLQESRNGPIGMGSSLLETARHVWRALLRLSGVHAKPVCCPVPSRAAIEQAQRRG